MYYIAIYMYTEDRIYLNMNVVIVVVFYAHNIHYTLVMWYNVRSSFEQHVAILKYSKT